MTSSIRNLLCVATMIAAATLSFNQASAFTLVEIPLTDVTVDVTVDCLHGSITVSRVSSTTVRVAASACGRSHDTIVTDSFGAPSPAVFQKIYQYGLELCTGTGNFSEITPGSMESVLIHYAAYSGWPDDTLTCN